MMAKSRAHERRDPSGFDTSPPACGRNGRRLRDIPSVLPFRVLLITDDAACARAGRGVVETVARALLPEARGVAVLVRMKRAPVDDVAATCAAVRAIAQK